MGFSVIDSRGKQLMDDLIECAINEDLGAAGDITSTALFAPDDAATAVIRSKSPGVLSGCYFLKPLFHRIDPSLSVEPLLPDGAALSCGSEICRLNGPVNAIIGGERIALNLLQRMSGIATLTACYVAAIAHTRATLLDTRKTTPGLRYFEKMAVRHGGGANHRFGLFDMVLIKDTHVKRAGGIAPALEKALARRGSATSPAIEVEVQNTTEFETALALRPDRIMLDNMNLDDMRSCVEKTLACGARVELEASGAVTLESIAAVAETGVDFISCGAITHSAPALDIHLIIR
jgi:nicotinate-nucleotide pyrophosphorylase (carboxylating)